MLLYIHTYIHIYIERESDCKLESTSSFQSLFAPVSFLAPWRGRGGGGRSRAIRVGITRGDPSRHYTARSESASPGGRRRGTRGIARSPPADGRNGGPGRAGGAAIEPSRGPRPVSPSAGSRSAQDHEGMRGHRPQEAIEAIAAASLRPPLSSLFLVPSGPLAQAQKRRGPERARSSSSSSRSSSSSLPERRGPGRARADAAARGGGVAESSRSRVVDSDER